MADPAAEFNLTLAASDGTSITELTLVNVNTDSAVAALTLYGSDGRPLSTVNTNLTGRGFIRQTLTGLFGAQVDLTTASHIRVNADRPIIGYEVVVNYLVSGNDVRRETASVSGQGMTSATSYVLPGFVTGGGWLSLLGVVNGAGIGQQITLTAYKRGRHALELSIESHQNPPQRQWWVEDNGSGTVRIYRRCAWDRLDSGYGFRGILIELCRQRQHGDALLCAGDRDRRQCCIAL